MKKKKTSNFAVLIFVLLVAAIYVFSSRVINKETKSINSSANPYEEDQVPPQINSVKNEREIAATKKNVEVFLNSRSLKKWQVNRNSKGQIVSVVGGETIEKIKTATEAKRFVSELVPHLGSSGDHVMTPLPAAAPTLIKSWSYKQTVDGYDVYAAVITIITRTEDGAVIMINNSLKPIATAPELTDFTVEQAWRVIEYEREFLGRQPFQKKVPTKPVVYAEDSDIELAWVFNVELQNGYDLREVLVGLKSRRILSKFSMLAH